MNFWISLIGYQVVWFAAVIGAGRGLVWPAVLGMLIYAAWQLTHSLQWLVDLKLMTTAVALGLLLDGVLLHAGWLTYATAWPASTMSPAWMLALWATFALTFTQSLKYLQNRLLLASLLGAIGGPLAYLSTARGWHAVTFAPPTWHALLCLCIAWALITPLLARLARHWSGIDTSAPLWLRGHTP